MIVAHHLSLATIASALSAAACDGESTIVQDGAVTDARRVAPLGCEPMLDRVYVGTRLAALPADQGRDIDGDGDVDNVLGLFAAIVNPGIAAGIAQGTGIWMTHYAGLAFPPPATARPLEMQALAGRDADVPPDPSDNHGGEGRFIAAMEQFDAWCRIIDPIPAVQDDLAVTGAADEQPIVLGGGLIAFRKVVFEGSFAPDGASLRATLTGIYTYCDLSRVSFPGENTNGTALVNVARLVQGDIDLDGDGLEQIIVEDGAVVRCIDGHASGAAVIEGATCPCDPAIADGYSFAIEYEAVPGKIVGTYSATKQ